MSLCRSLGPCVLDRWLRSPALLAWALLLRGTESARAKGSAVPSPRPLSRRSRFQALGGGGSWPRTSARGHGQASRPPCHPGSPSSPRSPNIHAEPFHVLSLLEASLSKLWTFLKAFFINFESFDTCSSLFANLGDVSSPWALPAHASCGERGGAPSPFMPDASREGKVRSSVHLIL